MAEKLNKEIYCKLSINKDINRILTYFHLKMKDNGKYTGYQITVDEFKDKIISVKQISKRTISHILTNKNKQYEEVSITDWAIIRCLCLNI